VADSPLPVCSIPKACRLSGNPKAGGGLSAAGEPFSPLPPGLQFKISCSKLVPLVSSTQPMEPVWRLATREWCLSWSSNVDPERKPLSVLREEAAELPILPKPRGRGAKPEEECAGRVVGAEWQIGDRLSLSSRDRSASASSQVMGQISSLALGGMGGQFGPVWRPARVARWAEGDRTSNLGRSWAELGRRSLSDAFSGNGAQRNGRQLGEPHSEARLSLGAAQVRIEQAATDRERRRFGLRAASCVATGCMVAQLNSGGRSSERPRWAEIKLISQNDCQLGSCEPARPRWQSLQTGPSLD